MLTISKTLTLFFLKTTKLANDNDQQSKLLPVHIPKEFPGSNATYKCLTPYVYPINWNSVYNYKKWFISWFIHEIKISIISFVIENIDKFIRVADQKKETIEDLNDPPLHHFVTDAWNYSARNDVFFRLRLFFQWNVL